MTTYYITSSGDTRWLKITAKTLMGAKRQATSTYQVATGAVIKVAERVDCGECEYSYLTVAVKRGYRPWEDVPEGGLG